MKKIALLAFSFAISTTALVAQVRFGAQAGATFSTLSFKEAGIKISGNRVGFTAGAVAEMPLFKTGLCIRPSLNFTQLGGKIVDTDIIYNYLELPLDVVYKTQVGPGKLVVGVGPNVAVAISGKYKEASSTSKVDFGNDVSEVNRLNIGGNLSTGYELSNGLFFGVNYNLGLSNISNVRAEASHLSYFGVKVGYFFGTKK